MNASEHTLSLFMWFPTRGDNWNLASFAMHLCLQLVYEGEDNHVDATPGNSPTFAASAGAAVKQELLDPRGLPVLTRRTTSLKSAQGFRVSVKRVRLYLPGGKPALSTEPLKPAEQQGELVLLLPLLRQHCTNQG